MPVYNQNVVSGGFRSMSMGGSFPSGNLTIWDRDPELKEKLMDWRRANPGATREEEEDFKQYTLAYKQFEEDRSQSQMDRRIASLYENADIERPKPKIYGRITTIPTERTAEMRRQKKLEDDEKRKISSKKAELSEDIGFLGGFDAEREKLLRETQHQDFAVRERAQKRLEELDVEKQLREANLSTTVPVGSQQLAYKKVRDAETAAVMSNLADWIRRNPKQSSAISEINKLLSQAKSPGANAGALAAQALAIAETTDRRKDEERAARERLQGQRLQAQAKLQQERLDAYSRNLKESRDERQAFQREMAIMQREVALGRDVAGIEQRKADKVQEIKGKISLLEGKLAALEDPEIFNDEDSMAQAADAARGVQVEIMGWEQALEQLTSAPDESPSFRSPPSSSRRYNSPQELAAAYKRGEISGLDADRYARSMGWE